MSIFYVVAGSIFHRQALRCIVRCRVASNKPSFALRPLNYLYTANVNSKRFVASSDNGRARVIHRRRLDRMFLEKQAQFMIESMSDIPKSDTFGVLAKKQKKELNVLSEKNRVHLTKKSHCEPANDWTYTFGTLSRDVDEFLAKYTDTRFADDEGEEDESDKPYVRLSDENRKHKPFYYGDRISKLGKAGNVYEAMEVLEKQMLKEDRVMPNQFVFTVLIGILGRVGYTKKAFQLFNKMKKFGLSPEDPTFTALFNACSNSPWPEDGLQRADELRRLMSEKGYSPNMMTFNSMIKAYAKCGDVLKAFAVVDEAIAAGYKPRGPCYCFILMACVADKDAGTKLAIEVWRVMRRNRVLPSVHHYNLLLRAVRDCGVGDPEFVQQLLVTGEQDMVLQFDTVSGMQTAPKRISQIETSLKTYIETSVVETQKKEANAIQVFSKDDLLNSVSKGSSILDANVPDLLDPYKRSSQVIELNVPRLAESRLALLGGVPGILNQMHRSKAQPDIKTFSLLLDLVPSTRVAESDLLSAMMLHGVRPDIDFFNMLIRRRNLRRDYSGAQELLELMKGANLQPTIRTFGCLAMGCPTLFKARELVEKIQATGMIPNVEICEILLYQSHLDFSYKLELLHIMKSFDIKPTEKFIEKIERSIQFARKKVIQKERGEIVSEFYRSEYFAKGFRRFMVEYKSWLLSMKLEPKIHPWDQFRQPTPSLDKMNVADKFTSHDTRTVLAEF